MSRVEPWIPANAPSTVVPSELTSTGTVPAVAVDEVEPGDLDAVRIGDQRLPAVDGGRQRPLVDDPREVAADELAGREADHLPRSSRRGT